MFHKLHKCLIQSSTKLHTHTVHNLLNIIQLKYSNYILTLLWKQDVMMARPFMRLTPACLEVLKNFNVLQTCYISVYKTSYLCIYKRMFPTRSKKLDLRGWHFMVVPVYTRSFRKVRMFQNHYYSPTLVPISLHKTFRADIFYILHHVLSLNRSLKMFQSE